MGMLRVSGHGAPHPTRGGRGRPRRGQCELRPAPGEIVIVARNPKDVRIPSEGASGTKASKLATSKIEADTIENQSDRLFLPTSRRLSATNPFSHFPPNVKETQTQPIRDHKKIRMALGYRIKINFTRKLRLFVWFRLLLFCHALYAPLRTFRARVSGRLPHSGCSVLAISYSDSCSAAPTIHLIHTNAVPLGVPAG